jgi:two-component system CheB/CheR fusion protein
MALGGMDMTENTRLEAVPRENEQTLRRDQIWLTAQGNAFRAAMNGAPLETSLGLLMQTVVEQADGEPRCAFYISDGCGGLRHVVGMSDAYAAQVRDLEISAESLAVAKGEPVITPDVLEEPRWRPWLWLAQEHGYRASWSFPVETASGKLVGSCAMYYREPRKPSAQDLDLTSGLTMRSRPNAWRCGSSANFCGPSKPSTIAPNGLTTTGSMSSMKTIIGRQACRPESVAAHSRISVRPCSLPSRAAMPSPWTTLTPWMD